MKKTEKKAFLSIYLNIMAIEINSLKWYNKSIVRSRKIKIQINQYGNIKYRTDGRGSFYA